jgi:predicted Zn-dependent peptidase
VITHEYALEYPYTQEQIWRLTRKQALFEHHPRLSHYDTALGTPEEFQRCRAEEAQLFYDRYYTPANMSVVSIGQSAPQRVAAALHTSPFGMQKPGQRTPLPGPFALTDPQTHALVVSMSDYSRLPLSQTTCLLEWTLPASIGIYTLWVVKRLLYNELTNILRHERSQTYHVDVRTPYYQDCSLLQIEVEIAPDASVAVQETIWNTISALPSAQVALQQATSQILNPLLLPDFSGEDLLNTVMDDLEGFQRLIPLEETIRCVQQVTLADIADVATYLTPERAFLFLRQP